MMDDDNGNDNNTSSFSKLLISKLSFGLINYM